MSAWLQMTNGVDLTGVDLAEVSWWMFYDMAPGDWCSFWESEDGLLWSHIQEFTGSSNGWQQFSRNINTAFYENYYIRFIFNSGNDPDIYEGFYLDDIVITGEQFKPDLEIDWPGGWSWPLVLSNVQGTNIENYPLYSNEPYYVDWALWNNGDFGIAAPPFHATLYVDNSPVKVWAINGLGPWPADTVFLDFVDTLGTGLHTLKIVADSWNEIDELNESNNEYQIISDWVPRPSPNLTYNIPPGWTTAIRVNALYADVPTYIDFAVINNGGTPSGPFAVQFFIDGFLEDTYYFASLNPGVPDTQDDIPFTFSAGQHIIRIQIDYNNAVIESNESDNSYQVTKTWVVGGIAVDGDVEYIEASGSPSPIYKNADGFLAELWDADSLTDDDLLASDTTISGTFSFPTVGNFEEDGTRQDIYVRVYSRNQAAVVGADYFELIDGSNTYYRAVPYYHSTYPILDVPHGWRSFAPPHGPPITIDTSESGFFFIADVIKQTLAVWTTLRPTDLLGETHVLLQRSHPDSLSSFYVPIQDIMHIEQTSVPNTGFPDTWDKDIIVHEFGHRIHFRMEFLDSILTTESNIRTSTSIKSKEFAAREAFGNFWACISKNDSIRIDYYNNFQDTSWNNLESGKYGSKGNLGTATIGTTNTLGKQNVNAVAGILWDIYDNQNDELSDSTDWYDGSGPLDLADTTVDSHHVDGIKDTLSLGADEILNTLFRNTSTGHQPDNIDDFWEAWFLPPSQTHVLAMLNIWYEHGDDSLICIGLRGDVNSDGIDCTILDQTYMVDIIFRAGPPSPRPVEADVNADGITSTILDLTYIIDRIFRGGPPPPACP